MQNENKLLINFLKSHEFKLQTTIEGNFVCVCMELKTSISSVIH